MAITPPCNLFSLNDQTHIPTFRNTNDDEGEFQVQLLLDVAFAEELQFQEVLTASLLTCQMPSLHVEVKGESSSSFCSICMKWKDNDQLMIENGACGHSFCLECLSKYLEVKIKEGMTIVTCPSLNCACVLDFESFKHLLSEDVINLLGTGLSMEMIPDVTCSKQLQVKTTSDQGSGEPFTASRISNILSPAEVKTGTANSASVDIKQIVPENKHEEPVARNILMDSTLQPVEIQSALNYSCNSQSESSLCSENKGLKPDYSCFRNRSSLATSSGPRMNDQGKFSYAAFASSSAAAAAKDDDDDSDSDALPDTDDYDSEASPRSPEACKKNKWFKKFVKGLECLGIDEIKDPARLWHCPACRGGAGAIKRYLSVQTLIQHAKTKGSTRVRLHRELAQLLEEKLHNDPVTSATPERDECAKWIGLKEEKKDHGIVWPPMVVITNTIHKKDDNDKWIGMTTQELLDLFSSYDAIVKAQHSYNYKGHCGTSILIFESSARGYLEAERLHKDFEVEGTGRNAWNTRRVYFLGSGERQLYGYMAVKEDVDIFNKRSSKPKLKYEMRSYQEMVVNRIRQMSEDNHQLLWLKNRVAEQQRRAKELEESNNLLTEKLENAAKEMVILRRKANEHLEQSIEELEALEQFYKDQIKNILEARNGDAGNMEDIQMENVEHSNADSSYKNDHEDREDEVTEPAKSRVIENGGSEIAKLETQEHEETNVAFILNKEKKRKMAMGREEDITESMKNQHIRNQRVAEFIRRTKLKAKIATRSSKEEVVAEKEEAETSGEKGEMQKESITPVTSPVRVDDEVVAAGAEFGEINHPEVVSEEKKDECDIVEDPTECSEKSNDGNDQIVGETDQNAGTTSVTVESATANTSTEVDVSKQTVETDVVKQVLPASSTSTIVDFAERIRRRAGFFPF